MRCEIRTVSKRRNGWRLLLLSRASRGRSRQFHCELSCRAAQRDRIYAHECKAGGIKVGKAVFPWAASGRAIANGRDEGFTKLLFDGATHRIVDGGIVGTHAGDLISEICLAIEMGCEPADIVKTIHPHPTLGESIGMAAEVFEGHCTDLPPLKRK